MTGAARKFSFDVEFSEDGEILRDSTVQRVWNAEEVQSAQEKARAEGVHDAEAEAAREQAAALKAMAGQLSLVLAHLTRLTDELRRDAGDLALTAARKIAGTALERFPEAEIEELVDACAAELRGAPRLKVTLPAAHAETLRPKLEEMLAGIGFAGALRIEESEAIAPGGCALDWEQGSVSSDPEAMRQRIEEMVEQRLAEPPPPQLDLFASGAPDPAQGDANE